MLLLLIINMVVCLLNIYFFYRIGRQSVTVCKNLLKGSTGLFESNIKLLEERKVETEKYIRDVVADNMRVINQAKNLLDRDIKFSASHIVSMSAMLATALRGERKNCDPVIDYERISQINEIISSLESIMSSYSEVNKLYDKFFLS